MGKDVFEAFPAARQVIEEAEDALKIPLRKLMFDGPMSTLTRTQNAQPGACPVYSFALASTRVLTHASSTNHCLST